MNDLPRTVAIIIVWILRDLWLRIRYPEGYELARLIYPDSFMYIDEKYLQVRGA